MVAWFWWCLIVLAATLVFGFLAELAAEARDRRWNVPPGQMVDDGRRRLHILRKGTAPGPTVVIEQGAGSPSILWWPIQNEIASFARVCTYDRAGYQWSKAARRSRSLADRATDLHVLLVGATIPGPYILVAHSFGGPLARLYASTYPGEVAGMVLVDTPDETVMFRRSYLSYARKIARVARLLEIVARFGLVRVSLKFWRTVPDGFTPGSFAALKAFLAAPAFFRAMADDTAALDREPPVESFGSLGDRPLVVLQHGIAFPGSAAVLEEGWAEGQQRLARLSTRGELIIAQHSNHMIQSDEPQLVIDAVRRVVDEVRKEAVLF